MNIDFTPEDEAFRDEVRGFIAANLPRECADSPALGVMTDKSVVKRWHKTLYEKGWAAPAWPEEYGGTGWNATQRFIFNEEIARANAPRLMPFGLTMVGPVIYTFGNAEQKSRHLQGILSGDVWWCQGYSEPGAGSDLASLKTTAVRDGDHYVVNGQKIWTSYAHEADWIFCLVRTEQSVKRQEGISFLLIDMTTPGIEVRPIISIAGLHHLNEVFFTDVKVPVQNLIGEENKGWTYAKYLLVHERTSIGGVPESKKKAAHIRAIARAERNADGGALMDDPAFQRKLAEIEVRLTSLEYMNLRILADAAAGKAVGPQSSLLKIVGSEVQQALGELAVEAVGYYIEPVGQGALPGGANARGIGPAHAWNVWADYGYGRAASIYGGSNEIQHDVIAKAILNL